MRVNPKAVIFDYGNVLSQDQPLAEQQTMASMLDVSLSEFTDIYWRFRVEYDAGALEPGAYWNNVATAASRTLASVQISELIEIDSRSWSYPAPLTPQWARDLRAAGFRTALLSNMPVPVRDYVVRCPWLPCFDVQTFSCDFGFCKPDPEIYWQCLNRLAIQPSEVLFIDDRESNIRAAEKIGLNSVIFTNPAEAALEIGRRFSLSVTGFTR